jgi:hypothetical protein
MPPKRKRKPIGDLSHDEHAVKIDRTIVDPTDMNAILKFSPFADNGRGVKTIVASKRKDDVAAATRKAKSDAQADKKAEKQTKADAVRARKQVLNELKGSVVSSPVSHRTRSRAQKPSPRGVRISPSSRACWAWSWARSQPIS